MSSIAATLLGTVLIALALRDIFHQLFHPSGAGSMSGALMKGVWRAFRPVALRHPSLLALAGPSALIAVIANWVVLVTVGWALLYWPRLPEQFLLAPGLDPSKQGDFVDALYLSLVTLTTLGYGNIAPTTDWLRVLTLHTTEEKFSLRLAVPYLARLAEQADGADHPPQVRMRLTMLAYALEDFSTTIGSGFLGMPSAPSAEVLQAYARDHLHASSSKDGG